MTFIMYVRWAGAAVRVQKARLEGRVVGSTHNKAPPVGGLAQLPSGLSSPLMALAALGGPLRSLRVRLKCSEEPEDMGYATYRDATAWLQALPFTRGQPGGELYAAQHASMDPALTRMSANAVLLFSAR